MNFPLQTVFSLRFTIVTFRQITQRTTGTSEAWYIFSGNEWTTTKWGTVKTRIYECENINYDMKKKKKEEQERGVKEMTHDNVKRETKEKYKNRKMKLWRWKRNKEPSRISTMKKINNSHMKSSIKVTKGTTTIGKKVGRKKKKKNVARERRKICPLERKYKTLTYKNKEKNIWGKVETGKSCPRREGKSMTQERRKNSEIRGKNCSHTRNAGTG